MMYDLIVVGGGPAGLTAAIYAIRKRLNVLLVSKDLGGKTNFRLELPGVEDYQVVRGLEIVGKFRAELEYLDFARHMEPVDRISRHQDGFAVHARRGGGLLAKAVVVASGTTHQRLNVPGEKELLMRGLCYSAISYAPLFIDKTTAVIGDGDLALRSAAELSTVAEHVYVVGPRAGVLESTLGRKLKEAENVTILEGYRVIEILGEDYAERVAVQGPEGQEAEVSADGTFIEMALIPNSDMVAELVDLDTQGRIKVDGRNRTSVPGIFAAGDVTDTYAEQVLVAAGEGAKAALSAYEYLLPTL
ncbi:MAG: FAD-dependent oxidoreductase [Anaerolineales bacterium]|nr:MAG: FAD-dependent oxidoreductase [Anaerolineales bacterium]